MTIPTFAPGVNPSFPWQAPRSWPHDRQDPIKAYVRTIPKTIRPIRRVAPTWKGLTADQRDYILSFFHRHQGPASIFWWTPPDTVESPLDAGPDLAQVTRTGAPAGPRTYSIKFTWYSTTEALETKPSPPASISMAGGRVVQVTPPYRPAGCDAFRVYAGTVVGSEWYQADCSALTWEEPIAGLVISTFLAPEANNCRVPILWTLSGEVEPVKDAANRWTITLEFLEQFC